MVMIRQMSKQQKRVYSLEPNKLVRPSVFARKYVHYLLLALKKIHENVFINSSSKEHDDEELEKIVGYQVNMAMVLSAATSTHHHHHQFAWSRALKQKLLAGLYHQGHCFHRHLDHLVVSKPLKFLQNPNCNINPISKTKKHYYLNYVPNRNSYTKKRCEETEMIRRRLGCLRKILPGGNEMGENELLEEVGSYITCLQLQVTILQCLVGSNSPSLIDH